MDAAITAALGFLVAVAWVAGTAIVLALTVTVLAVQLAAA